MKTKALVLVTIISLFLIGCQPRNSLDRFPTSEATFEWEGGTALIPGSRSGYSRQGISFRNFSVNTDNGIYYISSADPFLLYIDDGSNDMIPVCNRPDCLHAAQDFSKWGYNNYEKKNDFPVLDSGTGGLHGHACFCI